ncbi:MAG: ketoacyl-ACP synthase III [Burkholderiales bacterium]|nr:ketoacyl-ACP synthase III [Bacteroidia bacterium]
MSFVTLDNISFAGVSACVPHTVYSNLDYSHVTKEERELFIKTTGIKERRVAGENISTSDLCYEPAKQLIEKLNWDKNDIDVVIMVTQSPDYFIPGSAIILQHKLGLKKSCLAFDINLGCSGYIYGLYVLGNLLSSGQLKKGILLAGDKSTMSTAFTDKSAYPLFGDAGSATALQFDKSADTMYFNMGSDGSGKDAINIEHGGSRHGIQKDTFDLIEIEPGISREKRHLKLDGIGIFNFALREVSPNVNELYHMANEKMEDTDFFIFHQANKLINESVRKKLKITDISKVLYSLEKYGNTSSASIPLTMVTEASSDLITKENTLCLSGFGVGFSWGSALIKTNQIVCLPLIELM